MSTVLKQTIRKDVINRKQLAIEFAKSLNHPEIVQIILFGSVARGDDNEDSDIDILLIVSKENDNLKIASDVYGKVTETLYRTNQYISVKMKTSDYFNKHKSFSFLSNVIKEGVIIG